MSGQPAQEWAVIAWAMAAQEWGKDDDLDLEFAENAFGGKARLFIAARDAGNQWAQAHQAALTEQQYRTDENVRRLCTERDTARREVEDWKETDRQRSATLNRVEERNAALQESLDVMRKYRDDLMDNLATSRADIERLNRQLLATTQDRDLLFRTLDGIRSVIDAQVATVVES